jgi:O-antigen ligase
VLLYADSARWRVIRWAAFLLVLWAIDGFVQLLSGSDLFGIAMHPDRLNAMFIKDYQFFGPTLAMLSPLLLEHARRRWPPWAWVAAFSITLGAVLISGMRSGWLLMGIVLLVYVWLMFWRDNQGLRKVSLSIPVVAVTVIIASYLVSPLFQARLDQSLVLQQGTDAALDAASTYRMPIFKTSLVMFENHPVNGVGVRAYPAAYMEYADEDDFHIRNSGGVSGAIHAHNLVLEVMADTGTIGLIGLIIGCVLVIRLWRAMTPAGRIESFPFVMSMALMLFPLNSHFALYGTYMSSLIWILFGLWAGCIEHHASHLGRDG